MEIFYYFAIIFTLVFPILLIVSTVNKKENFSKLITFILFMLNVIFVVCLVFFAILFVKYNNFNLYVLIFVCLENFLLFFVLLFLLIRKKSTQ